MRSERKRGELNAAAHRIFNAVCVLRTWEDFVKRSFLATSIVILYVRTAPRLVPWSDGRSKIPQEISISGFYYYGWWYFNHFSHPPCYFASSEVAFQHEPSTPRIRIAASRPPPCVHCLDRKAKHQFLLFSPTCGLFSRPLKGILETERKCRNDFGKFMRITVQTGAL